MLGGVQSRKGNYSQRIERIKQITRGDSLAIMAIKAIPKWRRVPALCAGRPCHSERSEESLTYY